MTVSPEIKLKIAEFRASGQTVREIASALNIGKSTVSSILKTSQPIAKSPDIITHVPLEEMPASISFEDTESFIQSIEPPVQAAPPDLEQKAFLRNLAKSIRTPNPVEEVEVEAPVRRTRAVKARAEPKPQVQEPVLDKGTLVAKITTLVQTFAPILTNHVKEPAKFIESLPGRSVSDLTTTLQMLESTKTIANGANGMRHLFSMMAGAVELIGPRVNLKTSGYQAAILSQEAELRLIFQELAYNNLESIKKIQGPEVRLAMLMTQTLLATDARNRANVKSPVSADVQERFSDL